MNPISKAIDEIKYKIPAEILQQAFITQEMRSCGVVLSLDTIIREKILEPRVFVDIDIHGGTEAFIQLAYPVQIEYSDPYTAIYHIPDEATQNRPITQVYSVHFGILGYQNAGMVLGYTETPMGAAARRVMDSAMRVPPAQTSYLNLIAHNVVMVRFTYVPHPQAFMRVRLGNDNALSHIRLQAYTEFAQLCVLAVKAYIYNKMVVPMGQALLSGGQELGIAREIISSYADAEEMYQERLVRWRKIALLNDAESNRRHLRAITGSP